MKIEGFAITPFIDFAENVEANNVAAKVEAAIKAKAQQEEIQNILKEATDEEQNEQFSPLKVKHIRIQVDLQVILDQSAFPSGVSVCPDLVELGQQEFLSFFRRHRQIPSDTKGMLVLKGCTRPLPLLVN